MGKPKSSTSWSSLFGLGCFSSSHAAHSGDSGGSRNAAKVASSSRPPAPAPLPLPSPEDLSLSLAGSDVVAFTVEELRAATRDFSMTNFVGEGGFGPVYKGRIDDRVRPGLRQPPQAVAVKLLDLEGSQGHKEWLAEVIFLGQLRHPHLVKLIGYCYQDQHRLLVYEFMARGSLEKHLFKIGDGEAMRDRRLTFVPATLRSILDMPAVEEPSHPTAPHPQPTEEEVLSDQQQSEAPDLPRGKFWTPDDDSDEEIDSCSPSTPAFIKTAMNAGFTMEDLVKAEEQLMSAKVIFRATYWARFWSILQKKSDNPRMKWACRMLETAAMEIFAKHGWLSHNRLSA